MKISFTSHKPEEGVLCLGVFKDTVMTPQGQDLNVKTKGYLEKAMEISAFSGEEKEVLSLILPPETKFERMVLFGLGNTPLETVNACDIGGTVVSHLQTTPHETAVIVGDTLNTETIVLIALGALLRSWRFDKYRTNFEPKEKFGPKELVFFTPEPEKAAALFAEEEATAHGIFWTRTLVSEPGNVINPVTLAQEAQKLKTLGVSVEVLDETLLREKGFAALMGVGQGSDTPPRLVVLQWQGNPKPNTSPIAFVGKGVTFDTGGISLKPSERMDEMKGDMAGAAVILGLFHALAAVRAPVHAVGVLALAENMPSGKAQRPGDIVKSLSGQTIEVLNTDAEGRLILADALWYTQSRFHPEFMVDLATLTGAMRLALGSEYAGIFSNNDGLAHQLIQAGQEVGEKLWRLPLGPAYNKAVGENTIADMTNIPPAGFGAGSIIAGQFLGRFVNNVPWAHLDIAAVESVKKPTATCAKGATGFGVRLLRQWLRNMDQDLAGR